MTIFVTFRHVFVRPNNKFLYRQPAMSLLHRMGREDFAQQMRYIEHDKMWYHGKGNLAVEWHPENGKLLVRIDCKEGLNDFMMEWLMWCAQPLGVFRKAVYSLMTPRVAVPIHKRQDSIRNYPVGTERKARYLALSAATERE